MGTTRVTAEQQTEPVCIACGGNMQPLLPGMFDDRYGYPGYFDIFECVRCGQGQTIPLLEDSDLSHVYGNYYPRKNIVIGDIVNDAREPMSGENVRKRQRDGTDNQGQYLASAGMTVLDYGCGSGTSLLELAAIGADAYGIEADPNVQQVIDHLKLRIHIGMIDDAPYREGQFDMIILNQVLEHLPDPAGILRKLRRLLKPSGTMALSFPNAGSVYARLFGRQWINWHIPYHLHHFNKKSVHRFFERNGWTVLSARTITPDLWTYLQFKVAPEVARIGMTHPTWSDTQGVSPTTLDLARMRPLTRNLRSLALRYHQGGWPKNALSKTNRLIDRLGMGDSFLVRIAPADD